MKINCFNSFVFYFLLSTSTVLSSMHVSAADIASEPLYTSRTVTPLNMLVMGRDHKLYYEAYNDASDLDNDNVVDIRFKPSITYFGYFGSDLCYDYVGNIFCADIAHHQGREFSLFRFGWRGVEW